MDCIKKIGQILASLIYTPLYTCIMYMAIVIPIVWIVTLSFWKMLAVLIIFSGILEGLVLLLQFLGLMPFSWIVRENKVSFWISVILCICLPICNVISLWKILLEHGDSGIVAAILMTLMFIQFIYGSILSLYGLKDKDEEK